MADDRTPRNATTILNANTTTGDAIDERLIVQDDGVTVAKRAVSALGHSDNRLVGEEAPLPVTEADTRQLLGMILEEVRAIRLMFAMLADETSSTGDSSAEGELS